MDTSVTRMMKLIAIMLVLGFAGCAGMASNLGYWGNTWFFAAGSAISAGVFTVIWAVSVTEMTGLLGNKTRAQITTQNVIGSAVAFVSLIATVTFIATALTAAWGQNFEAAHYLIWAGLVANAVLTIIWTQSDIEFVKKIKNG